MKKLTVGGFALFLLSACMGEPGVSATATPEPLSPQAALARSECPLPSPHSGVLEQLRAGSATLEVEIADSEAEHSFGLMCRQSMDPNKGMLFEFDQPQRLAFWMKNTLIPLDLLFIGSDGTILNIAAQAQPLDETPLPSFGAASAVLELTGGRAAQLGLKAGDKVVHPFFRP